MAQPAGVADTSAEADKLGFWAARQICRRESRGFYLASLFLPKLKRDAAHAVYAFTQMMRGAIDQPADEPAGACGPSDLHHRMSLFRDRLRELYDGTLELPLPQFRSQEQHALHAVSVAVRRYEIPPQNFLDLAEGQRRDLGVRRYATWAALEKHCQGVAGTVGLILCGVLGLKNSGAAQQAASLGSALRLASILRDLKRDWDRGRLYLPLEDLVRFGYSEKDLGRALVNDAFVSLMKFEIARARELYRVGAEGICWLADEGSRLMVSLLAVTRAGILDAIERRGFDVLGGRRVELSTAQMLRRLPAAWRLARRMHDRPLPARLFGVTEAITRVPPRAVEC
jgi:phytoene synthase